MDPDPTESFQTGRRDEREREERSSVWRAMDLKKRRKVTCKSRLVLHVARKSVNSRLVMQILEKKKTIHDLIKKASSIADPLSRFDSFRRYQNNDLSVYLESGRGDKLSSSVKQYIRKLLKTNMEGFYGSDWPIQAKVKRKEMSSPDAHYIFVLELCYGKAYETPTGRTCMEGCNQIAGFVHYRFTLEEEIPVLYVYEIQLESRVQGKGLGDFLMQLIERIASKNRMSAIVLTVLTSNALAMSFYMSKLGYRISSISPSKANLPTFSAKYEILCRTFDSEAKSVLENDEEPTKD